MPTKVHTDTEALYAIKQALFQLDESLKDAWPDFASYFENVKIQTDRYIAKKNQEIEKINSEMCSGGRTDTFCCDTCGRRIMLKILGDSAACCEVGCNGTAHRVYNELEYQKAQFTKSRLKLDIETCVSLKQKLCASEERISQLMGNCANESINAEGAANSVGSLIMILDDYKTVDFDIDTTGEVKKKIR